MPQDLRTVVETGPLRIHHAQGRGRTLVVSCSDLGRNVKAPPPPQFYRSATQAGENHALFISDASRSWLNAPGMAERIVATIETTARQADAERIVGIGNSMGATMLLHLSNLTRIDTVLAFSPQYSVDPDRVPKEKRWYRFRRGITRFQFPAVDKLCMDRTYYVVLHGDAPTELDHALRFPWGNGLTHMILPGYGHRLAEVLKQENKLQPLVELAVAERHVRLRKRLLQIGAVRRHTFEAHHGLSHAIGQTDAIG